MQIRCSQVYTPGEGTMLKEISAEQNNHANRLTWSKASLTWLDGLDASASRVPMHLKAEV